MGVWGTSGLVRGRTIFEYKTMMKGKHGLKILCIQQTQGGENIHHRYIYIDEHQPNIKELLELVGNFTKPLLALILE
jgi:hypothetical protein